MRVIRGYRNRHDIFDMKLKECSNGYMNNGDTMKTDTEISNLIQDQINAIATRDETKDDVWADNPALAARLAFMQVALAWRDQSAMGIYGGRVPCSDEIRKIDTDDTYTLRDAA